MKRFYAIVTLLAALAVLSKLAFKPVASPEESSRAATTASEFGRIAKTDVLDPKIELVQKYSKEAPDVLTLVERVSEKFRHTALAVDRTDGLRGLRLLDRLDLEAVYLYEKHPEEFRRLRELLSDDSAADLLLHWREYFGLKRADNTDRAILVTELAGLGPAERHLAARFPNALPLILADPAGVLELVETLHGDEAVLRDALLVLSLISLERGAADLRVALRTLENHPVLALEAFRKHGLEGFALVGIYGPILDALGTALPLDQSLILLRVNSDYVDELLQTHRPESVARQLSHVGAMGLVEAAGGSPHALQLVIEFGERGMRALAAAGPDAADIVFGDYVDPKLRNRAVDALSEHGAMALVILDKYAADPDFREILRNYGSAVIPPIAQADTGPEALAVLQSKERRSFSESMAKLALLTSGDNGQAVIRMIKKDGLERVAYLNRSDIRFYQFLPLYDVLHLGNVLGNGHAPTSGEMTWALVDGCFVIADVLSLSAIQPEGVVATEAVRSQVKAAVREEAKSIGRELAESGAESVGKSLLRSQTAGETASAMGKLVGKETGSATRHLLRWWAVRSAGGVYQVMRRLPEALPRMSLTQIVALGQPLCAKAGLRLTRWKPFELLRNGITVPFRIPPERGLKYVGAQMVQASVGVVGFQKMEEHLASRRPRRL
jgi:hypothetical protein